MKTPSPPLSPISVLIVDDHPLFRTGVKYALSSIPYIHKITEADSGEFALHLMRSEQADVILMDVSMPGMDGIKTTKEFKKLYPESQIIALSMDYEESSILGMIGAGAMGYLIKTADNNEIDQAIRIVIRGGNYFSPEVSNLLSHKLLYEKSTKVEHLNTELKKQRMRDVLYLICHEFSNSEIGNKLFISHRTIEYHRKKLAELVGSKTTIGFMKFAQRHGILNDQELSQRWGM